MIEELTRLLVVSLIRTGYNSVKRINEFEKSGPVKILYSSE